MVSSCYLTFHKCIRKEVGDERYDDVEWERDRGRQELRLPVGDILGHWNLRKTGGCCVQEGDRASERWWMEYRWCFLAELLLRKVNVCLGMPVGCPGPPDAPPPPHSFPLLLSFNPQSLLLFFIYFSFPQSSSHHTPPNPPTHTFSVFFFLVLTLSPLEKHVKNLIPSRRGKKEAEIKTARCLLAVW